MSAWGSQEMKGRIYETALGTSRNFGYELVKQGQLPRTRFNTRTAKTEVGVGENAGKGGTRWNVESVARKSH